MKNLKMDDFKDYEICQVCHEYLKDMKDKKCEKKNCPQN